MQETMELIELDSLDVNQLPELKGWKETQLKIVEENPFVKIENHKTYEEAKKARTALVTARTTIEKQEKARAEQRAKEESERKEREAAEAAAKKRADALKPDKEKLANVIANIGIHMEAPEIKDKSAQLFYTSIKMDIEQLKSRLVEELEGLK